jgi:ubiquinone/menaquinone biosynthesis C-methylase UbiE
MTEILMNQENIVNQAKANEGRDYEIYDRLMDAALEAKARSIFPHFGDIGKGSVIIDAGSGTGAMAELAAREFRGAHVYAVDVSHELMERASESHALSKIVYADAATMNFPDNFADIIYFSTSGHEIESFGGRGRMGEAVSNCFRILKPKGRLINRDFVKPGGERPVLMEILTKNGDNDAEEGAVSNIDYNRLSTQALFERFYMEFNGGNAFRFDPVTIDGQKYIKLLPEWAYEFYMRKDYTGNWRQEIHEKYSYWTFEQARQILEGAGYRDVQTLPDPNEYILKNRLLGKIALFDIEDGVLKQTPFPPTHMVDVGTKPEGERRRAITVQNKEMDIDYKALKETIDYDPQSSSLKIGEEMFKLGNEVPIKGSKKTIYFLANEQRVLKVVKTDALSDHAAFKAMYQAVEREDVLDELEVPHLHITSVDPKGPPYRYFIQEQIPNDSECAADLIRANGLTETDIMQMSSYINKFEIGKKWQLDTNPFNWFRVTRNSKTEMVYVDGKVYRYDAKWEFRKIGLSQWINPAFVNEGSTYTARIPKAKEYEQLQREWENISEGTTPWWWKKYLNPIIQPA